jgi:hypothetical protein
MVRVEIVEQKNNGMTIIRYTHSLFLVEHGWLFDRIGNNATISVLYLTDSRRLR